MSQKAAWMGGKCRKMGPVFHLNLVNLKSTFYKTLNGFQNDQASFRTFFNEVFILDCPFKQENSLKLKQSVANTLYKKCAKSFMGIKNFKMQTTLYYPYFSRRLRIWPFLSIWSTQMCKNYILSGQPKSWLWADQSWKLPLHFRNLSLVFGNKYHQFWM